ncbi:hypothetical protein CRUP_019456 [Coryphaenoides rupestris]|nr:hypothetical protein CRUP_019456 [Coryphaenoides rupestris]
MANGWLLWLTLSAAFTASYSGSPNPCRPQRPGVQYLGNFHFKTFDGDLFQLPSSCNYVLTSLCKGSYADFNVQMRRQLVDGMATISSVVMKLDGLELELSKSAVVVNGKTNHTCGLCGDFNGVQLHDEFYVRGVKISPLEYANFWKKNGPTETCNNYLLAPRDECTNVVRVQHQPAHEWQNHHRLQRTP